MSDYWQSEPIEGGAIETLFERSGLPRFELSPELTNLYGGGLGFERSRFFANFVSSADGVVALHKNGESGKVISGNNPPDQFVMGLLRACSDAVMVGAGTFRAADRHFWHPEAVFPAAAPLFARLRGTLGLRPNPLLVVLTGSGAIDASQPALRDSLIVTTPEGRKCLGSAAPPGSRVLAPGSDPISMKQLADLLCREGLRRVLVEGGPTLVGELVHDRLLDELFLTVSPRLFGRIPGNGRKSLFYGVDLSGMTLELLSAKRHGSHLFLRYAVPKER